MYQKARSEAKAEMDLDKNSYLDLVLRSISQPEEQRYVQIPNGETLVYLFSRQQAEVLPSRGQKVTAYFDSTGSVVRPITAGSTVYYYALVINIFDKVLPMCELISSQHDIATISCFFINYKRYFTVTLRKSWPPFNCIVSDWSFALICGICLGLNEMTLYRYISTVYFFVVNKSRDLSGIIIIRCCCAHFIKMIINKLSKIKVDRKSRKLLVEIMSCFVVCETLESLVILFRALVTILLSAFMTKEVENSLKLFLPRTIDHSFSSLHNLDGADEERGEWEKERGKYLDSPFYVLFFKIYNEVSETMNKSEGEGHEKNHLQSEEFARYILHHCMPFVPLWTGLLNNLIDDHVQRYSNSNVECWFKIVKKDMLQNERRLKIGRFVENCKERIFSIIKTIKYDIENKPRKKRKSHVELDDSKMDFRNQVDNPLVTEKWRPKKVKQSYFDKKRLERNITKNLNKPVIPTATESKSIKTFSDFEAHFIQPKLTQYAKEIASTENEHIHQLTDSESSEVAFLPSFDKSDSTVSKICEGIVHPFNLNTIRSKIQQGKVSPANECSNINTVDQNVRGTKTMSLFFKNALLLSSEYYLSCDSRIDYNFIIGAYEYDGHRLKLYSGSYAILISNYNRNIAKPVDYKHRWLPDEIIDSTAYSILGRHHNIYYINAISTTMLFSKQCDDFSAFNPFLRSLKDVDFIILPVNVKELHWYLLVLDLCSKTAYIFDSGGSSYQSKSYFKERIRYFFNLKTKFNGDTEMEQMADDWQVLEAVNIPKQKNAYNCGVYLLFFVYIVSKMNSISKTEAFLKQVSFDPEQFRLVIQQLLLVRSTDMSMTCLYCGQVVLDKYATCSICKRRYHVEKCVRRSNICDKKAKCSLCILCDPRKICMPTKVSDLDPLVIDNYEF